MSAQKRKRAEFTPKEKKIIDAAKNEPNQSKLAREMSKKWGIEVKRTTVKGILNKKDAIEAAINVGIPSKRMKLTQSHNPKLDDGVLMWLKQARGQNLPFIEGEIQIEPEDAELLEIWKALPPEEKTHENETIELFDFLSADDRLVTGGSFTLEEIAKEVMHNEEPVESEDDEVIVEEEYVSFADAQRAWSTIRKFMQQQSSGKPSVMQACDRLDNEMNEIRRKKMRQPTILRASGLTKSNLNLINLDVFFLPLH
ncbi:Hypothetical predicted protein [Octopus vulgaris]|uniref:HTH psq-type domain-containing protein n=1 Tax=Octopus vulgaris TaxID=6645 RepID=A0AA36FBD2_OCTVU|nr:Hypothetical predicted protein [Octopus vulgaris]